MKQLKPFYRKLKRHSMRGQTLVVALIIMGLLLIIGFIFIGILNRNIRTASTMQNRSAESDLSEAGIRYAHSMLLNSEEGADWRGKPNYLFQNATANTNDPDIYYLRPAAPGRNFRPGQPDLGGPDGLGPYIRVQYRRGRALVRVRYSPSDVNIFNTRPTGALRNPGLARNYLVIESVGRQGVINTNDPTTMSSSIPVQYTGFADDATLQQAVATMGSHENAFGNLAVNRAFVSIGIIESARFITNKYNVTRPAEIGISNNLGITFEGQDVGATLPQVLGGETQLYTPGANPTLTANPYPGFGSIFSNADLRISGHLIVNVNKKLGDIVATSGKFLTDGPSDLTLNITDFQGGTWTSTVTPVGAVNSGNAGFSTAQNLLQDGVTGTDVNGNPRGIGRKVPPSIDNQDSDTGVSRYVAMTRDSGTAFSRGNTGINGYGRGVYVNNATDRQTAEGEIGMQARGSDSSLEYDWLNPNNGKDGSGWKGSFYIPIGAYVSFTSQGFIVTRGDHNWLMPDGTPSTSSQMEYRLGTDDQGRTHIVNSNTQGVNIRATIIPKAGYARGPLFNGVLYFEGNVRVRGIIPTDAQLTLVSNATAYIEGSLTKGVIGNGLTPDANVGDRITRLSKSMLMIMAKDYVAVNTTMFTGTAPGYLPEPRASIVNAPGFSSILIRSGGDPLKVQTSFVLDSDSATNKTNPSTWLPYQLNYRSYVPNSTAPGQPMSTGLLLSHAMDDGVATAAFLQLFINKGAFDTANPPAAAAGAPNPSNPNAPESQYFFALTASNLMTNIGLAPVPPAFYIYGMGEAYQKYNKFETSLFPILDPTQASLFNADWISTTGNQGRYKLATDSTNDFEFDLSSFNGTSSSDYLVGKIQVVPQDVKIEASVFAEEGSFFVIPGQWTNPDPNDRRDSYPSAASDPLREQRRLENYGANKEAPFYSEPPDIHVTVVGSVTENMPPSMDKQAEITRKWGWIPVLTGASNATIPFQHVPLMMRGGNPLFVPNLSIVYDQVLATARPAGFNNDPAANPVIRTDSYGRALPPLPRLPVSPALAFFGEVR